MKYLVSIRIHEILANKIEERKKKKEERKKKTKKRKIIRL